MSRCHKTIYIGKIIREKVDERGIGYAEFARRINCSRTSLYSIFNSKSIDIDRLLVIQEVLEFDFIHEIYLNNTKEEQRALIQIPFKNGKADTSDLSQEIIAFLKQTILEQSPEETIPKETLDTRI